MGIFSRMKRAIKSKANAAVDKAIDPEKELDMAILELEEARVKAYRDLLSYKTNAKQMEQDIARLKEKVSKWETRAMEAVKAGDDELAKECLREKTQLSAELAKIIRDRDEAEGYAIELNRSRKEVETRLKILKLKRGSMATQIAAARSGGKTVFSTDEAFDRLERAEELIDEEAIEAEVSAALEGEDESTADLENERLDPAARADADEALAALKAAVDADREKRLKK